MSILRGHYNRAWVGLVSAAASMGLLARRALGQNYQQYYDSSNPGGSEAVSPSDPYQQYYDTSNAAAAPVAQGVDYGMADGIVERVAAMLDGMSATAGEAAIALMTTLLAIDLVWGVGRGIVNEQPFPAMVQRFVFRIGFVALVVAFIGIASEFTDWLITTAITLGQSYTGKGADVNPTVSGIFKLGAELALDMLKGMSVWQPASIFYVLCALGQMIVTGIMVAVLLTVYIEFYIVALAGLVVLGFAGLESTKDAATNYVRTLIGKAFKLLGLLVIFAIMSKMTLEVADARSVALGFELVLTIMLLQVVTVVLLMTVPASLEGLAGGVGSSRVAEIVGGIVAAKVGVPLMKTAAAGSAGGAGGAAAGATKGAAAGFASGGIKGALAGAAKGAMSGGASGAASYGKAALFKNSSVRAQFAKDVSKALNKGGSGL